MNANTQLNVVAILLLSLFVAACGGGEANTENTSAASAPVKVNTYTITDAGDVFMLPVGGQVVAADRTYINAKTNGFVRTIMVELGEEVAKDQVLARIANEELSARKARTEAMVNEAKSGFELAEIEFNRMQRLLEAGSATQREFDMAKSGYERAKAGLEQAQQALNEVNTFVEYTTIRAPFAGTVAEKMIDEGSLIDPSRPLFVIEKDAAPEVEFFVPTSLYDQVKSGQQFDVMVEGINTPLTGNVVEISSSAAQAGGQFRARLVFSTAPENLLNGSYAKVLIPQQKEGESATLIPEAALVRRGELVGVYVVSQNGQAMLRWIRTGKMANGQVEALSGLSVGETIILDAPASIRDGVAVQGV